MIPTKARENRLKMKMSKLSKNLERRYKEVGCRECTVVVTPMDFAKILGKFTKVKIQYERSAKTKPKQTNAVSPNSRQIKAKENGMVQIHRSAYNAHPAQKLLGLKSKSPSTPTSNVLKENNILKKPALRTYQTYKNKQPIKSSDKLYQLVFQQTNPVKKDNEIKNKFSLQDLISDINKKILPTADWAIDYFPKSGEPKDDKIYDRIAAELEDLMYNEKVKSEVTETKNEEFPSILDILNENSKDGSTKTSNQANTITLESSDVEAMLMGNSNQQTVESTPMEVDDTGVSSFINAVAKKQSENGTASAIDDNPASPSILEEPVVKEATLAEAAEPEENKNEPLNEPNSQTDQIDENDNTNTDNKNSSIKTVVTHIVFRKTVNGTCSKSVTCPKNLKYTISMQGKSVELIGAPRLISSLEDLQVLLQIVEESELNDFHVHTTLTC